MKLKTYEKSEKVIQEALKEQANDLNSLISQAKFTGLLAMVHERSGDIDLALRSLTEAKEIRAKLLKRIQVEQPDAVLDHKQLTANICHQMAEHAVNKRDFDTGNILLLKFEYRVSKINFARFSKICALGKWKKYCDLTKGT